MIGSKTEEFEKSFVLLPQVHFSHIANSPNLNVT